MTVRMEKARKTRNRFPSLSHRALGNRCSDSHIPTAPVAVSLFSKPKRKEPLATDLHLFRSGSFFDEKMLPGDACKFTGRFVTVDPNKIREALEGHCVRSN